MVTVSNSQREIKTKLVEELEITCEEVGQEIKLLCLPGTSSSQGWKTS